MILLCFHYQPSKIFEVRWRKHDFSPYFSSLRTKKSMKKVRRKYTLQYPKSKKKVRRKYTFKVHTFLKKQEKSTLKVYFLLTFFLLLGYFKVYFFLTFFLLFFVRNELICFRNCLLIPPFSISKQLITNELLPGQVNFQLLKE